MKRYIAPIIVTALMILFSGGYAAALIFGMASLRLAKVWIIVASLFYIGSMTAMIAVLIQRIREIRKEDPDDYRKY